MADAFTHVILTALGKVASASAERWLDGSVGGNPIGKGVFAVLDDAVYAPRSVRSCKARDSSGMCQTYALLAS